MQSRPQRSAFDPIVIRASAGTGKTFRLTGRFLRLALADQRLDDILATTFTRKAAGEILDRVLLSVAQAAGDDAKLARLARQVDDGSLTAGRCLGLLQSLVRLLHRLRIGTLDSFFIQIAQSFSLELGLPPGWRIVDEIDDASLRRQAIRDVLAAESTSDVVRLMHLLAKGDVARSVSQQIADLVNDLYKFYVEAPPEAWDCLPRTRPLDARQLDEAIRALDELPPERVCTHKSAQRAHREDVALAREGHWERFLARGLAGKRARQETDYAGKPIHADAIAAYEPLLEHAKAELVGRYANQTEATRALLEHFDRAYLRRKLARRALRFEDVTGRLAQARIDAQLDEVAFRIDGRIDHLLLDEFQDTSPAQWGVVLPFARRAADAAARHSFFCVGDVKQAIYGWRGGVAEIFDAIETQLPGLVPESLNESYRSSQPVIDTVNRVFGSIAGCAALDRHADAAVHWQRRFTPHTTARGELPGHCRLLAAPAAPEGQAQDIVTLDTAADEIARLHRQSPRAGVGVLVRRNQAVARLMYLLRQRGIEASEEGGNPLTQSVAVELVLSLLRLADHPGDTAARYHVAQSPLGPAVGFSRHDDDAAAERLARQVRRRWLRDGCGPTLAEWVEKLAPSCDARDLNRLTQLVELGYAFQKQATPRVDGFVEFVRKRKVEDPSSAPVRVMTVHQSKGLQFDIVVLPELGGPFSPRTPQVVAGRRDGCGPVETVCRYVPKPLHGLLPERITRLFETETRRGIEESLCVLYVALTRAIHALHMIVPPSREEEKTMPATFAGILRSTLAGTGRAEPGQTLYEHGDPEWYRQTGAAPAPAGAPAAESLVVRLAPSPPGRRDLERRSPSELEGGDRVDLPFAMRLDSRTALDRGTVLHAWFEQIEWLDHGDPSDAVLDAAVPAELRLRLELPAWRDEFRRALARPAVRAALTRATYEPSAAEGPACAVRAAGIAQPRWRVWREKPLAVLDAGSLLTGSIDRLVVLYDAERAVGADILDYKTDAVSADDPSAIAERAEHYRPQLEAYRRAVACLYRLPPDRISARILFVGCGLVRGME